MFYFSLLILHCVTLCHIVNPATLTLQVLQVHNVVLQFSSKKPASILLSALTQLPSNLCRRANSHITTPTLPSPSPAKREALTGGAPLVLGGVSVTLTLTPFSSLVTITGLVRSLYADRKSCDFIQASHDSSENEVNASPVRCCNKKSRQVNTEWNQTTHAHTLSFTLEWNQTTHAHTPSLL